MQAQVVEQLREQIRKLQAAPRSYLTSLRTHIRLFDELLPEGGLVLGQAVELHGEAASGRTSLALRALASATREQRLCAYVDGPKELYPPAARAFGVDLSRLLIVRPKAPGQLVWTAVQLLRSGAFAAVVLDVTHTGVRLSLPEARKLQEAALKGGTLLLLLTPPEAPGDGMLRLQIKALGLSGLEVEIVRSRRGGLGDKTVIAWEALYPQAAPVLRYEEPDALHERTAAPAEGSEDAAERSDDAEDSSGIPRIRRVRTNHIRDSPGLRGSRPGRDMKLPPMGTMLGPHV